MKKIVSFFFLLVISLSFAPAAYSASLSFSPSSGQYEVGKNFSVTFLANTDGKTMNASSGTITFPTSNLEVVSISKTGSIFSLWVQEPTFSNASGTINFEGVVLNPGFSGNGGKLLTVTFKPKTAGSAQVKFNTGSILANDGLGTNIASTLSTANYTFVVGEAPVPETPSIESSAPKITSTTHPDQDAWYNSTNATFDWKLPNGALETKILIGRNDSSTPTVSYIPPISTKTVEDLKEGTYYFSLQIRTASGWSPVGRFKVNIDTVRPADFTIISDTSEAGQPLLSFETSDAESGFSHYEMKIGDGEIVRIDNQIVSKYPLPLIYDGEQDIVVTAFDKAGNSTTSNISVTFPKASITKPIITSAPETVEQDTILSIEGTAVPGLELILSVARKGEVVFTEKGFVDEGGKFNFMIPAQFSLGYHTVVVSATSGDTTLQSNPVAVKVVPSPLLQFAITFVSYLGVAILVVVGLASFIKIILYFTSDLRRTVLFLGNKKVENKELGPKRISSPLKNPKKFL